MFIRLDHRHGALLGLKREHHTTSGIEQINAAEISAARAELGEFVLRNRLPLGDANSQCMREDPFDIDRFNGRHQFQIAFDAREIERQQIVLQSHTSPPAQLLDRDDAVGLHVQLVNGKSRVFGEEAPNEPFPSSPGGKQSKKNRTSTAEQQGELAQPALAAMRRAQLNIENMIALEAAVLGFALRPHGGGLNEHPLLKPRGLFIG